ncbi:MAG TPA: glycosyltransferase [Candidatus Saccharimonadales bacterium]|nr:glycosyltransferase [Candidatus Saccharimonadales bacterium]
MRILIGSLTYPLHNGVTNSINTSVDGFVKAGQKIQIVAPRYQQQLARPEHRPVMASPLSKFFLQLFGKEERMFGYKAYGQIKKIAQDFGPDAYWLHTITWAPNAFERAMIASKKAKVVTYHTLVEMYGQAYGGELGALRMVERSRKVCNAADIIITPSQVIADKLRSYEVTKPIKVIPTGILKSEKSFSKSELAEKYHFSPDNALLIFVGRISKEKNISALIKMAATLAKMRQDFTLLLVGPGDIEETQAEAKKMDVEKQVILTDGLPLADSKACYGAADAFVFASQSETQGLVLGEAMIAGTPVVALNSPIQAEVYPEEVAVVVRDETQFASEVNRLLCDKSLQEKLAVEGKKFVEENFSVDGMISKQITVFESVTAKVTA